MKATAVWVVLSASAVGAAALQTPTRSADGGRHAAILAALRTMANSVTAGDATTYARLYADDATIEIYGTRVIKGRAAIEQYEVELLREYPGTRLAFYDAWLQDTNVIVRYGVNGPAADGRRMGHEGLLFFRFDPRGRIVEERRYLDSMTPMAQLGTLGLTNARPIPSLPAEMTTSSNSASTAATAAARALIATIDAGDEGAFLSRVHDDVVLDEIAMRQPFSGRRGAARWFEMWRATRSTTDIKTLSSVGDTVLVECVMRGTLNGTIGQVTASAAAFAVHRALVLRFTDGKLTALSAFMNGKELAEAVGQWPPR